MTKFSETFCSQCGAAFGPGNYGFSHCDQHETAQRVVRMNAANPFLNERRFAIQVWRGSRRDDFHAPSRAVADIIVGSVAKPDASDRPDRVTVYDNRACLRVVDLRRSWLGYSAQSS